MSCSTSCRSPSGRTPRPPCSCSSTPTTRSRSGSSPNNSSADDAIRAQLHEFLRLLHPDRFPALVTLGKHVWLDNREERLAAGLQVLIDGLEHLRNAPHRRRQQFQQTTDGSPKGRGTR